MWAHNPQVSDSIFIWAFEFFLFAHLFSMFFGPFTFRPGFSFSGRSILISIQFSDCFSLDDQVDFVSFKIGFRFSVRPVLISIQFDCCFCLDHQIDLVSFKLRFSFSVRPILMSIQFCRLDRSLGTHKGVNPWRF